MISTQQLVFLAPALEAAVGIVEHHLCWFCSGIWDACRDFSGKNSPMDPFAASGSGLSVWGAKVQVQGMPLGPKSVPHPYIKPLSALWILRDGSGVLEVRVKRSWSPASSTVEAKAMLITSTRHLDLSCFSAKDLSLSWVYGLSPSTQHPKVLRKPQMQTHLNLAQIYIYMHQQFSFPKRLLQSPCWGPP